jgi:hypothetical protein
MRPCQIRKGPIMIHLQELPSPTPTPIPVEIDGNTIPDIIDSLQQEPFVFGTSVVAGLLVTGLVLFAMTRGISKAGTLQPPVTTLAVLTALVAMLSILGVVIRPNVDSLAVAAGTAVGALAGALGPAFSSRAAGMLSSREIAEKREQIAEEEKRRQEEQDDDDGDDYIPNPPGVTG